MAIGVPLVTTRVGQAADLVEAGVNGWMVDVEDVDALAGSIAQVADAPGDELARMRVAGHETARANSYPALRARWRALLEGFVALGDGA
jgi:glycosyltransferase involved in cell wall biosynthesis